MKTKLMRNIKPGEEFLIKDYDGHWKKIVCSAKPTKGINYFTGKPIYTFPVWGAPFITSWSCYADTKVKIFS